MRARRFTSTWIGLGLCLHPSIALAAEAPESRPVAVAENSACAAEFEQSLRSLSLPPKSQLPAVISPTNSQASRPVSTIPALRALEPPPPHYAEMAEKFFLKAGQDPIFLPPNRQYEFWLDAFVRHTEKLMGIQLSGSPLEKLKQLKSHPRVNGFNPADPKDRDALASAALWAWHDSRYLTGDRLSGPYLADVYMDTVVKPRDPAKASALNRVVSDNLPQYMQIWEDYFALAAKKDGSLKQLTRDLLWKKEGVSSLLSILTGAQTGAFAGGYLAIQALGDGSMAMGGLAGMALGATAAVKGLRALRMKYLAPGLNTEGRMAIESSYEALTRMAALRASAADRPARLENAWTSWTEWLALSEQRKQTLALSHSGDTLAPTSRFERAWSLEMTQTFADDLLHHGTILRAFHEAELPNGMKFADLERLNSKLPPDLGSQISTLADRRKVQLQTIRSRLEETASSIEETLQATASESHRLRHALAQTTDAAPESLEGHGNHLRQLDTAIELLKIQLEQAHQLIASAAQEAQLTEHLESLLQLQNQANGVGK